MSICEMKKKLKSDGKWIVSVESAGKKLDHSYWYVFWNDIDNCEHIKTDGTLGGASKAWNQKMATEKAVEMRFKAEYPSEV